MNFSWKMKRWTAGALAVALSLGFVAPAGAAEAEEAEVPGGEEAGAEVLAITTGEYTCKNAEIQAGGLYTLIALPLNAAKQAAEKLKLTEGTLNAEVLKEAMAGNAALYVGFATATAAGSVTFHDVRLRTAEAADYFVTGPGLDKPATATSGSYVTLSGEVASAAAEGGDKSATVWLVDTDTGYRYNPSATADKGTGAFTFTKIVPGSYYLRVEKKGYLVPPYETAIEVAGTTILKEIDLSGYVGDVNDDGKRDKSDLTTLLGQIGKTTSQLPEGVYADLNGDGKVDAADGELVLDALVKDGTLNAGSGDATGAKITVTDELVSGELRKLTFALTGAASGTTITAGAMALSFRNDQIQPTNASGGAISPADGGTMANGLVQGSNGLTIFDKKWTVEGNVTTLHFTLSGSTTGTVLATFYYKPKAGLKPETDFYDQTFTLSQGAVVAGQNTLVTAAEVTYPNSTAAHIGSLAIDAPKFPGEGNELTVPATGKDTVLVLSATGYAEENLQGTKYENLSGVNWLIYKAGTQVAAPGVTVEGGVLRVTSQAQAGEIDLYASRDGVTSEKLTITLKEAPLAATTLTLLRNSTRIDGSDAVEFEKDKMEIGYALRIYDQYGREMKSGVESQWSLSGAPEGLSVSQSGVLTRSSALAPGKYTFKLHVSAGKAGGSMTASEAVTVTATVPTTLAALKLAGPLTAAKPGEGQSLELQYSATAVDNAGQPYQPEGGVNFTLVAEQGGSLTGLELSAEAMSGGCTILVTDQATAGEYTLTATYDKTLVRVTVTLTDTGDGRYPAVKLNRGEGSVEQLSRLAETLTAGKGGSFLLTAVILDAAGKELAQQPKFSWTLDKQVEGITLENGTLTVAKTMKAQMVTLEVTAQSEEVDGVRFKLTLPVELTLEQEVGTLTVSAPSNTLEIPEGAALRYALVLTAKDLLGQAMNLDESFVSWRAEDADGKAVKGVTVENGVLNVAPSAKAGEIYISAVYQAFDPDTGEKVGAEVRSAKWTLTLTGGQTESRLVLYRDGSAMESGSDRLNLRTGESGTLRYKAYLVDSDGTATEAEGVQWLSGTQEFTVSDTAEWGVYTTTITAVLGNQTAAVTAEIAVYPRLKTLKWKQEEALKFPVGMPKTYQGPVVAVTESGEEIPLNQLIEGYEFGFATPLTGMHPSYDEESNLLKLVVETGALDGYYSLAESNRVLALALLYFPGDEVGIGVNHKLDFTEEKPAAKNAVLRLGTGTGNRYTFTTAHEGAEYTVAAGTLSYVFALEILDQYMRPMENSAATVKLTREDGSAAPAGIELLSGKKISAITGAYPSYAAMYRLRVTDSVAAGDYKLKLNVSSGAKEGTANYFAPYAVKFTLKVTAAATAATLTVTGSDWLDIPIYYNQFSSATNINTTPEEMTYTAILDLNQTNQELDPDSGGYTITWKLENSSTGASLSGDGSSATLTVQPGAAENRKLTVTAVATKGGQSVSASQKVELSRSESIPTVIRVKQGSGYVSSLGTLKVTQGEKGTFGPYTFEFYDQYGDAVSESVKSQVKWRISVPLNSSSSVPSGIGVSKAEGTSTEIVVSDKAAKTNQSLVLSAYYGRIPSSTAPNDRFVFQDLTFTLVVGAAGGAGGGGGGGGGGLGGGSLEEDEEVSPSPTPTPTPTPGTDVTIVPGVSQNGSTGNATLTQEQEDALKNSGGSTVTIAPVGGNGLTNLTVSISKDTAQTVAEKKQTMEIQTSLGTVTLDAKAVSGLASGGNANVSVTVTGSGSNLAVTFKNGGKTLETLNGTVSIRLPTGGSVAYEVKNGKTTLLPKLVVENGQVIGKITGSVQLKMENPAVSYTDTRNHWAKEAIEFVSQRELFQGTGGGNFSPNLEMTRGMVVTVLHRLEQNPSGGSAAAFDDVERGSWYADGVAWANSRGIVQGSNGSFDPGGTLTREQLATILYRYAQSAGISTAGSSNLGRFSDGGSTSSWASAAMRWCVAKGLINGKNGNRLDPQGSASRSEVATTLQRMVTLMAKE